MTISKIIICLHMIASYQGFFQRRSYVILEDFEH